MKSRFKNVAGSMIELEISLDQTEFQPYWQKAYDQAFANTHLKGFRAGTAPKELADQAIDKEKVFDSAANEAARFCLDKITEENKWTLIDRPIVELLESSAGLRLKVQLTVFPEVRLGNYKKGIRKILAEKTEIKIESAEIERALEWLQSSRAKLTRVSRPAHSGDLIDIDLEGFVDGQSIEGANVKNDRFILGQGRFLPGFENNLENHGEGEVLNFSLAAPTDYWQENLRNKKIDFRAKINSVFEKEPPVLNDEFAKGIGKFANLDELRQNIKEGLLMEKQNKEKERRRIKILDEIVKESKIDMPRILIDRALDNMVAEYKTLMPKLAKDSDDNQLREKLKNEAIRKVAGHLVIHQISQEEHLDPTAEEVERRARSFAAERQKFDEQKFYDYIYGIIQNEKVFEYLEELGQ